ncbi:aurora kinase A-interacting protein [Rhinatrema bivittatum]|uniref:aurora kinase A-interacting protein n=1 Tax=Rhinatrema bivittatum TaxID=194408 RepID=UPI00112C7685|nr:aurora kinase A-interacting protein [Rhinatrema bivittatum]
MWLSRVTKRLAESLLARSVCASVCPGITSVNYSTQHNKNLGISRQRWYALDPELEEILVPRRMSISPLESWLTIRYSLPRAEIIDIQEKIGYAPGGATIQYDCPHQNMGEAGEDHSKVQCKNVLKIRRRKMNRHQYKKRQKRTKFLRRKILDGRRKKRQKAFERDLKRIWKKAGLRKPPEGWEAPKIFLKHEK